MRPLILFFALGLLSTLILTWLSLFTSPVDNEGQIVFNTLIPFLTTLGGGSFSFFTSVFFLLQRLFEKLVKKRVFSEQKFYLKRYWRTAIRRGFLTTVLIVGLVVFKVFNINNQLNAGLLLSIVVLTEILFWRYYAR